MASTSDNVALVREALCLARPDPNCHDFSTTPATPVAGWSKYKARCQLVGTRIRIPQSANMNRTAKVFDSIDTASQLISNGILGEAKVSSTALPQP